MRILLRDLTPGTNYVIQVQSVGDAGKVSEWSRLFPLTTLSDTVAPKTPTTFVGTMNGTSFNYTWDKVLLSEDETDAYDLDHYEVLIESTGSGASSLFVTTDNKFEVSFEKNVTIFTTPQANIECSVRAVDKAGNASAYTSVNSQTNASPTEPSNFVASSLPDTISMKWDSVADNDLQDYQVFAGTTAGFTPSGANIVYRGNGTSFSHLNVTYVSDTYYKLAAVDVFGTPSTYAASGAIRPVSEPPTDGLAPASSPTPESISGIGAVFLRWTSVSNADPITYDIHISLTPSFTPAPGNKLASTAATIATLRTWTDGEALVYDTTYYFAIIARDADGSAAPGGEVSGIPKKASGPDIAADYAYLGTITANQITAGTVSAELALVGSLTAGAEGGARVVLDPDGARLYDSADALVVNLPTDPALHASFSGDIFANGLTVNDNMNIRGVDNELSAASSTTLQAGVTAPGLAPSAVVDYDSVILEGTGTPALGITYIGSEYLVLGADYYARLYDTAGALISSVLLPSYVYSVTKVGTDYYGLSVSATTGLLSIFKFNSAGVKQSETALTNQYGYRMIGTDGTNLYVVFLDSPYVKIESRLASTLAYIGTYTASHNTGAYAYPSAVITGTFDLGVTRFVVATRSYYPSNASAVYVYSLSGSTLTRQTTEEFPAPTVDTAGLAWDGTYFRTINDARRIYQLTENKWTTESAVWWASYAWNQLGRAVTDGVLDSTITVTSATGAFDSGDDVGRTVVGTGIPVGATIATVVNSTTITLTAAATATASGVTLTFGTFETKQSPKSSFTMKKRARLTLTAGIIPTGQTPNVNSVITFLGRGATAPTDGNMFHTTGVPPIDTRTFAYLAYTFSGGSNPLTTSTFPAGVPAKIISSAKRSDGTTPRWGIYGDGSLYTTPYLLGSGVDLNTLIDNQTHQQYVNANATLVLNYPIALAGVLEVHTADGVMVFQRYTVYSGNAASGGRTFVRGLYASAWSAWDELVIKPPATVSTSGGGATNSTSTTFIPLSPTVGIAFVAPISGNVMVGLTMFLRGTSGIQAVGSYEIRAGSTIGSGTVMVVAGADGSLENRGADWAKFGGAFYSTGLTAGNTYHVRVLFHSGSTTSVSASVTDVIVVPLL